MLAVCVPETMEARLDNRSRLTGRPKSFHVRLALESQPDEIALPETN